jgi:hypothetical protein
VDGRIALIGVGAVVGDSLLGGKSDGVIANHVRVPRDASDCSLGSHGLDSSRAGSHRSWPWGGCLIVPHTPRPHAFFRRGSHAR